MYRRLFVPLRPTERISLHPPNLLTRFPFPFAYSFLQKLSYFLLKINYEDSQMEDSNLIRFVCALP